MTKYINSNPKIMGGKPVVKGTRIPISRLLFLLSDGYTLEMIHDEYPHVSIETLRGVVKELMQNIDRSHPYAS